MNKITTLEQSIKRLLFYTALLKAKIQLPKHEEKIAFLYTDLISRDYITGDKKTAEYFAGFWGAKVVESPTGFYIVRIC